MPTTTRGGGWCRRDGAGEGAQRRGQSRQSMESVSRTAACINTCQGNACRGSTAWTISISIRSGLGGVVCGRRAPRDPPRRAPCGEACRPGYVATDPSGSVPSPAVFRDANIPKPARRRSGHARRGHTSGSGHARRQRLASPPGGRHFGVDGTGRHVARYGAACRGTRSVREAYESCARAASREGWSIASCSRRCGGGTANGPQTMTHMAAKLKIMK